ncbi:MAG: septal ring lytic transglycosylase RlpA family protein [Pseudomonadota bacterium]
MARLTRLSAVPTVLLVCAALAGCNGTISAIEPALTLAGTETEEKPTGRQMIGKPYKVGGRWYHPKEDKDYDKVGMASWYGPKFHGRKTANGERFNQNAMTAAHPTLPLPSYVRVTMKKSGKSVVVRVNDRGPFTRGRIIDVSRAAAKELGFKSAGHAKVRVEYLGPAPVGGSDKQTLVAAKAFGKKSKKSGEGRSVRDYLPFGIGKRDEDEGDADAVEVRLASAQPEAPSTGKKRKNTLPGVAKRYTERSERREAEARAAAYAAKPKNTGAIDAVIAMNADPEPEPIKAQPLPETASAPTDSRFAGAHDMFNLSGPSGVSTARLLPTTAENEPANNQ